MTHEEYIKRVFDIGYDIHLSDGVWWRERGPFFYEPVIPYLSLEPGKAKPKLRKALWGYRHFVTEEKHANTYQAIILLNEEKLKIFGLHSLSRNRRKKVKKGLRLNEVIKIESIEQVINDMRDILISKYIRTGDGKPPEYYEKHYEKWKSFLIKQFIVDKGKKDYWGAFYNGKLVAYMTVQQIDDTVTLIHAASHTDYLDKNPNDAIRFIVIEYYKNMINCKKIVSGEWVDKPSLNDYKESYGFKRVDLPGYVKYNFPILNKLIKMNQLNKFRKLIVSYLEKSKK